MGGDVWSGVMCGELARALGMPMGVVGCRTPPKLVALPGKAPHLSVCRLPNYPVTQLIPNIHPRFDKS